MARGRSRDGVWKQCPCPAGFECVKKHGTWSYRVAVGLSPDGSPLRKTGSGYATRKEAVEAKVKAAAAADGGAARDMTVGQWLDTWLESLQGRERNTIVGYETNIRLIWKPNLGHVPLRKLTRQQVDAALQKEKHRSPEDRPASGHRRARFAPHGQFVEVRSITTLERYRATLRRALNVAMADGLVTHNAAAGEMEALREPKTETVGRTIARHKIIWKPEETKAFFASIAGHEHELLYRCYAFTGARRAEWLGASWSMMSEDCDELWVQPSAVHGSGTLPCYICEQGHVGIELKPRPKNPKALRELALNEDLARDMRRYRQRSRLNVVRGTFYREHGLVFPAADGGPLNPDAVGKEFQKLVRAASVPQIRGLHSLRHMVVSTYLELGYPVAKVAQLTGHTVATLESTYAHLIPGVRHRAAEDLRQAIMGAADPTPPALSDMWSG